ncbi:hypothetical protein LSH36_75g07025 [Paralvinella palmiformis]|uniref:Cilia- and flagella-associated protein 43 n=1 Tax=Paralvinella palmiformis TaxID=53620 RepID=A0AAD9K2E6_9ANNE|nr:hypothetical protein LSH36_75g07025 [Paralvinella palmiformis]
MDAYGTLDVAWIQGYNGQRSEFINRDVICFKCGNKIKFVHESGEENVFPAPTPDGIGVIAVQGIGHLVAFSNQSINPSVFVYVYPSFRLISELKDGAKLEYTKLAFSSSEYLATVSGIPDFLLTIWNFNTGRKLATHDMGKVIPNFISFNPANWRQLCMTTEKELSLWQIERSNDDYIIHKTKLKLPAVDGSDIENEFDGPTHASTSVSRMTVRLPQTSMAGVHGEEADRFMEYQDPTERVVPTEHVWTPSSDIIMGCVGGQLIKIDSESNAIKMLYSPSPRASSAMSRTSHSLAREESQAEDSALNLGFADMLTEGSVTCLLLHKKGLFVGGQDGTIRQLEIQTNQIRSAKKDGEVQVWRMENAELISAFNIGQEACCLVSSPLTHLTVVGTETGHIYFVDLTKLENPRIIHRIHMHTGPIAYMTWKLYASWAVVMDGTINAISTYRQEESKMTKIVVTSNTTNIPTHGATRITHFTLSDDVLTDTKPFHATIKHDFDDAAIHKVTYNFANPSSGIAAADGNDRPIDVSAHDFHSGGVKFFSFSADSSKMLTTGFDGTMCCYKWNFSNSARGKSTIESAKSHYAALLAKGQPEDEALGSMEDWVLDERAQSGNKADRAEKAHKEEDKQYSSVKQDLRLQIRDMRRKLQTMMKTNETVPDVEKLSHHDFDLDTEEQSRLEAEGEAEVERIRTEKEFENLAKMYLAELIRKQCWDNMTVKGRGITAFNSSLEVNNYPMKARDQKEMDELVRVKALRQIEINEMQTRKELTEIIQKATTKAAEDDDLNEGEDVEHAGRESAATTGSLGAEYGGDSELFYSQFELHTREQKMNQIVLLKDAIYRIKVYFDKQFDEVYHKKEQEIAKIKEKNNRIYKIIDDLKLDDEQVYKPELGVTERPELLLTVQDDEVKVERFLTPEQRKQLEHEQKAEEERRLREKSDNWRERGLDMMMGGVLEIKKEDELKKDIAMPPFMTAKPESEWTEDEKKVAQEYERKVRELNEEREKYRKQLETELRKLQSLIQESTQVFDETLYQLFIKKIKTEMVLYQEELKIHRMKYNLLLEEELDNRENELVELLEHKKILKNLADETVIQARKNMEEFHEEYRNLEVEEKLLDKNFKKEFNDVPAVIADHLYKLFKRKPRGQRARGGETPIIDPNSGNPFADRPSTARKAEDQEHFLEMALSELDKPSNAPEGCEPEVWTRLCRYRREKISNEQLVKAKAQVLADMEEFYKRRQIEDDTLKLDIDDLLEDINKLREDHLRFIYNLEVQLLMKQGQVEVDPGNYIYDYRSSILIHRNVVEELNGKIQQLGDSKIASMIESKDFRKGIIQLEWEHKKMTMLMEDLHNKMRDIQNLKVTREIQAFLNEGDHEGKKAKEISVLEQTILLMKQHHEKNLRERKKAFKELRKTIQDKEEENSLLDVELQDINVSVNERRHIHQVNADKRSDAGKEQRYREIVQRRKLVDLAKAQAQEVAVLRAEVERLRMRTFPALVQVEH